MQVDILGRRSFPEDGSMATPGSGERVQIEGRQEEFVVLRVDKERLLADLLRMGSIRRVENGIPLALLRPVQRKGGERKAG